ncbi:hypothetical protein SAMN05216378_2976 [Paenibacillus catalpae]|uniref:Uncharacterized protein n=1 Tax=Paenibacillus catalpae TaxID=1045775 RepID=A0A1I2A772_9BACL|nr:hypothetical protein [Paenibacillus catalpae]SFE39408.1 hypothetical protein SAMN05216378_2976 [Paenibacillus catalpae]
MPISPLSPAKRTERLFVVSPIRPYGSNTFREEEPTRLPPGSALFDSFDWGATYRRAAETAASWLQHSRQAQLTFRLSAKQIKHNPSPAVIEEELQRIVSAVNGLHVLFKEDESLLKPQLWHGIEQAMAHPAASQLGLIGECGTWQLHLPDSARTEISIQQLTGPKGWITCLHKALEDPLSVSALDLLRKDIPLLQPYSCYYNSMTTYWPFPTSGMLLNRRL